MSEEREGFWLPFTGVEDSDEPLYIGFWEASPDDPLPPFVTVQIPISPDYKPSQWIVGEM